LNEGLPVRLLLQWHITDACNLKCTHCYDAGQKRMDLPFSDLLDIYKQYNEFLLSLPVAYRGRRGHINITGGEPFVRKDFIELLSLFFENTSLHGTGILTNGSLLDASMSSYLKRFQVSFIQLSLEGSREIHDAIRGPGDYERTLQSIRMLARDDHDVHVSFTVHGYNADFLEDAALAARNAGARSIWCDRLIPEGRAGGLKDSSMHADAIMNFMKSLSFISLKYSDKKFKVKMNRALQFLFGGGKPYRCSAGDTLITIMPDGTLYPCRRLPLSAGNVIEDSLRNVYTQSPLLKRLREHEVPVACKLCQFRMDCNGGLRCLSSAVLKDPFAKDPGCWLTFHS